MTSHKKSKGRIAFLALPIVGAFATGVGVMAYSASHYVARVTPGVTMAGQDLGGLTKVEAEGRINDWWSQVAGEEIIFTSSDLNKVPTGWTPARLGYSIRPQTLVDKLPFEGFFQNVGRQVTKPPIVAKAIEPEFQVDSRARAALDSAIKPLLHKPHNARVTFADHKFIRIPEGAAMTLDLEQVRRSLPSVITAKTDFNLPMKAATKHVTDKDLNAIAVVVSEMSTEFNTGKATRCHNIQLASKLLNGRVFLPGEKFSFNQTIGERTASKGFQEAGVYKNGRHDFDIGGGICQVSTTLYNAILRANLKVVSRSPHTYPVPYVPLGLDAAVSFPDPDFGFINTSNQPIAISTNYQPGKLTFRILGTQKLDEEYRFIHKEIKSWTKPAKYIEDSSLRPGHETVVDRGGMGHEVVTWRIVLRGGKEIRRERMENSYYPGGPKLISINRAAPKPHAPKPSTPPPSPGL